MLPDALLCAPPSSSCSSNSALCLLPRICVERLGAEDTVATRAVALWVEEEPATGDVAVRLRSGGSWGGIGASSGGAGFKDTGAGWEGGLSDAESGGI